MHLSPTKTALLDVQSGILHIVRNRAPDVIHSELNRRITLVLPQLSGTWRGKLANHISLVPTGTYTNRRQSCKRRNRSTPCVPDPRIDVNALDMHCIDYGFLVRDLICPRAAQDIGYSARFHRRWKTSSNEKPTGSGTLGVLQDLKIIGNPCTIRIYRRCIGVEWNAAIAGQGHNDDPEREIDSAIANGERLKQS